MSDTYLMSLFTLVWRTKDESFTSLFIPVGLAVGVISALFGVGGGVIAVPALVLLYPEVPQTSIIGVSLGMIFFNSLINSNNFYKKGLLVLLLLPSLVLALG